jgi:hypothetical protein
MIDNVPKTVHEYAISSSILQNPYYFIGDRRKETFLWRKEDGLAALTSRAELFYFGSTSATSASTKEIEDEEIAPK